ncbi:Eukaryotic translation initiation factor 4E like protein [Spironucleus salmonicida]|uniref:Eukaryotic translation initiation factor 4E like protein n=1 Tax=Spironucleus salmonicida TaxID=348837 RepID=V6LPB0_9EUKA|nr:Eukaryotic translation initiation factor 4E like protein [Spironucleus salmonicida]|eukprot:EST46078.1 Eukaryotic translation initiation factor 4E like protein [Spironucleus salmonicida]
MSLHNVWKVFFTSKDTVKTDNFSEAFREVCQFSTKDEFAYVWAHLFRVSQLPAGTSIYFVRVLSAKSHLPTWENNINGGTYKFRRSYDTKERQIQSVDRIWEKLVFGVVSEETQEPIISTIQAVIKHDQVEFVIWHNDVINKRTFSRIQLKLGDILETKVNLIIYQTNQDSILDKDKLRKQDIERKQK